MDNLVFSLPEAIHDDNFVFAFYYLKLPRQIDVYKKASSLAIGQTIGTWVPVPGITDNIRKKYMGRVVNIFDIPSYELDSQDAGLRWHVGWPWSGLGCGNSWPNRCRTSSCVAFV